MPRSHSKPKPRHDKPDSAPVAQAGVSKSAKQHTSASGKTATRARRWAFTLFRKDLELSRTHLAGLVKENSVSFICFQQEVCPKSTRLHLQGYLELNHGRSMRAVKKLLGEPSVHLSQARDSPAANRAYCSKSEGVPDTYVEFGLIAPGQGWRGDLEAVRESLCGGVTGLELWDAHWSACVKYHRSFDRYEQLLQSKKRAGAGAFCRKRVTYLCGPSGSGKTSRALDILIRRHGFDGVYVRPNTVGSGTDWFEGLTLRHTGMLIDEFRSDVRYGNLMRVLDGYPHMVECKGRSVSVDNITEIFITSNLSPHEVYPSIQGHARQPFYRRINNYEFMDRWKETTCPMPDNRNNELTF